MTESTPQSKHMRQHAKLAQTFRPILFSDAVQKKKVKLLPLLKKKQVQNPEKTLSFIRETIEASLFVQLERYAFAVYKYMLMHNEWTQAGIDRVKLSMIRLMFDIMPDQDVEFSHYEKFEETVNHKLKVYDLKNVETGILNHMLMQYEITILNETVPLIRSDVVNAILTSIDSPLRLLTGLTGHYHSLILAECGEIQIDQYTIYYALKEMIRTPNNVAYMVALIDEKEIMIRKEVCEYVYYTKWLPYFDHNEFDRELWATDPSTNIAESLKALAIKLYGASSRDEFLSVKDTFVAEMMENFTWHELAHDLVDNLGDITEDEDAVVEGIVAVDENILTILKELMTEFVPRNDSELMGPIANIALKGMQGDRKTASRMLLMYLSDAWFLDTDTRFMYRYTYIMFTFIIKYFYQDEFNFTGLFSDLPKIMKKLIKWYKQGAVELLLMAKKVVLTNEKGDQDDFASLTDQINSKLAELDKNRKYPLKDKDQRFWINLFRLFEKYGKNELESMITMLEQHECKIYKEITKSPDPLNNKQMEEHVIQSTRDQGIFNRF